MKIKNITLTALALSFTLASCNDWLDVMPDNRAEIDTEDKAASILVSAYPEISYIMCAELASDNVDDFGASVPAHNRILGQYFRWEDVTETDNEDPKGIWEASYGAITNANQSLASIKEMGKSSSELDASRGEALLCRAYNHFVLVNMFCKAYNPATADSDLGIPYMSGPEIELNPKYERGTVAEVYEKIAKDLEEGLPLINDATYKIPKYHFNEKAAYTFASRFYLFYGKWDKAIECANIALGAAPKELLRDYATINTYPRDEDWTQAIQWNSANMKNNFLLMTAYSSLGYYYSGWSYEARISTGNMLIQTEIMNNAPWGRTAPSMDDYSYRNFYLCKAFVYLGNNFDKTHWPKLPMIFEYIDPVAGTGYRRTNYAAITAEEALLNRAEAYIAKGDFDNALIDINLWAGNTLNLSRCNPSVLTKESIKAWADGMNYYTPMDPTPKKHLNPLLLEVEEGSQLEAMLHAILYIRRIEFLQMGMRWFDVKRYGIEISRRTMTSDLAVKSVEDVLTVNDERRALQLPKDVITAGMTANPR